MKPDRSLDDRASRLLPPELAQAEHCRVAEAVGSDGFLHLWKIESDFGDFDVRGGRAPAPAGLNCHAVETPDPARSLHHMPRPIERLLIAPRGPESGPAHTRPAHRGETDR